MINNQKVKPMSKLIEEFKNRYLGFRLQTKEDFAKIKNDYLTKKILNGGLFVDREVFWGEWYEFYWGNCKYAIDIERDNNYIISSINIYPNIRKTSN